MEYQEGKEEGMEYQSRQYQEGIKEKLVLELWRLRRKR